MHRDVARACLDEVVDVGFGVLDHQVAVEQALRLRADRLDNQRPKRDIRDEMAVHDIGLQPVCPCRLCRANLIAQPRKIGR
jgi:adhesin HecA-like repeat protein